MKRTGIILLLLMGMFAIGMAQKTVAVWDIKVKSGILTSMHKSQIIGAMEKSISNAEGYEAYNRTALEAIMKEQNFQRSGSVSDEQIRAIGKMAGVDFILWVEVDKEGNEIYVNAKVLDIESGRYGKSDNELMKATSNDIQMGCGKLAGRMFGTTSMFSARSGGSNETIAGIDMIYVQGGTFTMGGGKFEKDGYVPRSVTLPSFYIGKYEVTQKQWKEIMGDNPSVHQGDDLPVENVNYYDCQDFIQKLNKKTGKKFRLPTAAEWEYAAMGGQKSKGYLYAGSNDLESVAWYRENSDGSDGKRAPHKVGTKMPNELGIYDMSGNVWEWTDTWFEDVGIAITDGRVPPAKTYKVVRGGSYHKMTDWQYIKGLETANPSEREEGLGFRLILVQE